MERTRKMISIALVTGLLTATGCSRSHDGSPGGDGEDHDASADAPSDVQPVDDAAVPAPEPGTAWDPPEALRESEWEVATPSDPLCTPFAGELDAADVWADGRGVFVLATVTNGPEAAVPEWPNGVSVHLHQETGWQRWYRREGGAWTFGPAGLTGVADGPIWLWPFQSPQESKPKGRRGLLRLGAPDEASRVDLPVRTGSFGEDDIPTPIRPMDVHMLEPGLGYTASLTGEMGSDFLPYTIVPEARMENLAFSFQDAHHPLAIWADRAGYFLLDRQALYSTDRSKPELTPPHNIRFDAPDGPYTAMWVNNRDDLWIATEDGRLLQLTQGIEWEVHDSRFDTVRHVWGTEETLFFASEQGIGRWTLEEGSKNLVSWDTDEVTVEAVHGHEETVYAALYDRRLIRRECGPLVILAFDGTQFRRL